MFEELLKTFGVPSMILAFGVLVWERVSRIPLLEQRLGAVERDLANLRGLDEGGHR